MFQNLSLNKSLIYTCSSSLTNTTFGASRFFHQNIWFSIPHFEVSFSCWFVCSWICLPAFSCSAAKLGVIDVNSIPAFVTVVTVTFRFFWHLMFSLCHYSFLSIDRVSTQRMIVVGRTETSRSCRISDTSR